MEYKIIIFPSVHFTLAGEQALKDKEIEHQVVPVPPFVNEGCGLGIRIKPSQLDAVLKVLQEQGVETEKVV